MKPIFNYVLKYVKITIAAVLYGAGVSLFLDPNGLITGGVTGAAMILHRLFGLMTGTGIFFMNIPILIIAVRKFGWRFAASTVYCTALCSAFTNMFGKMKAVTNDSLVAALIGGSILALGLGLAFKTGATTGGTDVIVKLLRNRFKHLKTGFLILAIDIGILIIAALVLQEFDHIVYGGLSVVATSCVLDFLLYGSDEAKLLFIISDSHALIMKRLLEELEVGATYLAGKGAFREVQKEVILCVVRKQISPKAEDIVKQVDPNAFLIICRASEIYGEGYKDFYKEKI